MFHVELVGVGLVEGIDLLTNITPVRATPPLQPRRGVRGA